VRRGANVIATNGVGGDATQTAAGSVSHAGFRNPDGSFVVVLANRGPEKRIQLVLGSSFLEIELPADSVHTLQWS
jgi:O-glycosyl hydrolase